jgi:hypothetical protein
MNKINLKKSELGFTIIETLIYIALFAMVIGGGLTATYQIIQSTEGDNNHVVLEEEANFLLRKINWALTGATSVTQTSSTLTISKNINGANTTLVFNFSGNELLLTRGTGTAQPLNSSSLKLSNGAFTKVGTNGFSTAFTLTTAQNGKEATESFSTIKYLRK